MISIEENKEWIDELEEEDKQLITGDYYAIPEALGGGFKTREELIKEKTDNIQVWNTGEIIPLRYVQTKSFADISQYDDDIFRKIIEEN